MKETLKKLIEPSLIKTLIICSVILYIAIFIMPHFYPKDSIDTQNIELEKQKLEWAKKEFEYLKMVDSLETHISELQKTKENNIVVGTQKKKKFRELTPTQQVIEFNNLFNTLTNEKEKEGS